MKRNYNDNDGLKNLIEKYRKTFQLPENLNYYSEQDFKNAERQFIKLMLQTGDPSATPPQPPPLQ